MRKIVGKHKAGSSNTSSSTSGGTGRSSSMGEGVSFTCPELSLQCRPLQCCRI
jgi:hypothetical protein